MKQEVGDNRGALKQIAISNADVLLIFFWSVLGGALCFIVLSRAVPSLLGWHRAVADGIGFSFVWLSLFIPLKVWSQVNGKRMVSGGRFLLASAVAGSVGAVLGFLMP